MSSIASNPTGPAPQRPAATPLPAWRRSARPYLLTVPAIVLTIGILYPFVLGAFYAFQNRKATRPDPEWVGLENFRRILENDSFYSSALVTLQFAVAATVVETLLGLGVALLLARGTRTGGVLERLLIMPLMIAPILATIIWKLMMAPSVGILSYMLTPIGLGGHAWTDTPLDAFVSVVMIDAWIYTPFVALLVLAGLRSLPRAPFEAAAVEGAGFWYTFRCLTLPMLWPYILVAVIFRFMDSLKVFDVIYGLTQGGPGDSLLTLQVRAYQEAITFSNYSRGLAYMLILWLVVYIATKGMVSVLARALARAAGV